MDKSSIKHPITGFIYAVDSSGLVRVTDPESDRYGLFDNDAVWYEDEIRDVDLQIIGWMGRTPEARRRRLEAQSPGGPVPHCFCLAAGPYDRPTVRARRRKASKQ